MQMLWCTVIVVGAGCGKVAPLSDAQPASDGATDAAQVMCDPTAAFGAPVPIPGLSKPGFEERIGRLSPDELTMYFTGITPASGATPRSSSDLYVVHRTSLTGDFDSPTPLEPLNTTTADETDPSVSSDGLTLWYQFNPTATDSQLYVATRTSLVAAFTRQGLVDLVNTAAAEIQPFITANDRELWFVTGREGNADIWRTIRTAGQPFPAPSKVIELASPDADWSPTLSADLLTIYFGSTRQATGTKGNFDIWTSHRMNAADGFPAPTPVPEVNTGSADLPMWLSPDNCRLYVTSDSDGNGTDDYDIFVATRHP